MKHLDIISHISFREKKNSMLKIITLPFAMKEIKKYEEYEYDISKEKYSDYISKLKYSNFNYCTIFTVFGDIYKRSHFFCIFNTTTPIIKIRVKSIKKMRYKNIYFNSNRRFDIIDV